MVILDQLNAMSDRVMLNVTGGTNLNGNLLSSIAKILSLIFDVGRAIGSSFNRFQSGNRC